MTEMLAQEKEEVHSLKADLGENKRLHETLQVGSRNTTMTVSALKSVREDFVMILILKLFTNVKVHKDDRLMQCFAQEKLFLDNAHPCLALKPVTINNTPSKA